MFERFDLLQKEIILPISVNWQIKYFKYKQYTIKETLDFYYNTENKVMWLFNFLNNHWEKKRFFWRYKLTQKEFMSINFEQLYKTVIGWLMKWFYDFDWTAWNWGWEEYPIWAYIALILKETPMSLQTLMDLTFEQLKCLSDWIIWNLNMQSDEGKKTNKKTLAKRHINAMNKEETKNILDKLDSIHKKQILEAKWIIDGK